MGSQQLLLIVLGVIVVGVAVIAGFGMFNNAAESSAQDAMVAQCINIASIAQQQYIKPEDMGGLGGTYVGFTVPVNMDDDNFGTYAATPNGSTDITIIGQPLAYTWLVTVVSTPTGMTTTVAAP